MNRIHEAIHRRGGVAATFELLGDGNSSHDLTAAVRRGEIVRIRQGHYGCPELAPEETQAIRVGGVASGAAGLGLAGIWAPRSQTLAVRVDPHARALRRRGDARQRLVPNSSTSVHWRTVTQLGTRTRVSVEDCLIDAAEEVQPKELFAMVESARYLGALSRTGLARVEARLPPTSRKHLRGAGSTSESGGESLLRFEMLTRGIPHSQQVRFTGVGRVDFLIGDGLVIEADGAEFHTDPASFENDRRRDALLTARGFRVLRFSYTQIRERPAEVWAAIEAALMRGDHWRENS